MKIREFNEFRSAVYQAAMENVEIAKTVNNEGVAFVYDLFELPDKHKIVVLSLESQLNGLFLQEIGFSPEKTKARLLLKVHRQRKTVDF